MSVEAPNLRTELGREALDASNKIIEDVMNCNEIEAIEVLAVVSSCLAALKAGYVASAMCGGLHDDGHLLDMMNVLDQSGMEEYIGILDTLCEHHDMQNPYSSYRPHYDS